MNKLYGLFVLFITFTIGCGSSSVPITSGGVGEKLIYSTESERPGWTLEKQEDDGKFKLIVGISEKFSTESDARDDAMRHAKQTMIRFLGTKVEEKTRKAKLSFGLSSSVNDASVSIHVIQKQLAKSMVKKMEARKWYLEQWNTESGSGWKAFVLAEMPIKVIDEIYKANAEENILLSQKKIREAADKIARKQAENALKYWKRVYDLELTKKDSNGEPE